MMRPLTICLALLLNSGVGTLSESAGANDSGSAAAKVKETTGPLRLLPNYSWWMGAWVK